MTRRWFRLPVVLVIALFAFGVAGAPALPAHAATTMTVSNCSNDSQLQADVAQANTDKANDTIDFSCSGTIPLTSTLGITGSMTIDGSGQNVTISGGGTIQLFDVSSGPTLTLNSLTLADGFASCDGTSCKTIGVFDFVAGAAIYNLGTVDISNSTLTNNQVTCSVQDCLVYGGAIYDGSGASLTVSTTTFSSNELSCSAPYCYTDGGAIYNDQAVTATIATSTFAGNAISCDCASATVAGGAIYEGGTNAGTLSVTRSTFANNSVNCSADDCGSDGGAITNTVNNVATISFSTFSGNTVSCTTTGFICFIGGAAIDQQSDAAMTVTNSTLAGNLLTCLGQSRACQVLDGTILTATTVNLGGTILSNSGSYGNCATQGSGTIVDLGYNLDTDGTCANGPTDIVGRNPDLGPLQDNGGPTETMALLSGSPAIDVIPVGAPNGLCVSGSTDQRGYPRPDGQETVCDIGAFEYQEPSYDIESSNWYCTTGGTACVPNGSVASACGNTIICSNATYADVEAFGVPNGPASGVPDELILYCSHGTAGGYDFGYLDVVSPQGNVDYPAGTHFRPGVYNTADVGTISGKATLLGGGGAETNSAQGSSVSASGYDPGRLIQGSVTGIQNTDNSSNTLNSGSFRVTLTGRLDHVLISGNLVTVYPYSGTISCTAGGPHALDLAASGKDTNALAEGEYEGPVGDNTYLPPQFSGPPAP